MSLELSGHEIEMQAMAADRAVRAAVMGKKRPVTKAMQPMMMCLPGVLSIMGVFFGLWFYWSFLAEGISFSSSAMPSDVASDGDLWTQANITGVDVDRLCMNISTWEYYSASFAAFSRKCFTQAPYYPQSSCADYSPELCNYTLCNTTYIRAVGSDTLEWWGEAQDTVRATYSYEEPEADSCESPPVWLSLTSPDIVTVALLMMVSAGAFYTVLANGFFVFSSLSDGLQQLAGLVFKSFLFFPSDDDEMKSAELDDVADDVMDAMESNPSAVRAALAPLRRGCRSLRKMLRPVRVPLRILLVLASSLLFSFLDLSIIFSSLSAASDLLPSFSLPNFDIQLPFDFVSLSSLYRLARAWLVDIRVWFYNLGLYSRSNLLAGWPWILLLLVLLVVLTLQIMNTAFTWIVSTASNKNASSLLQDFLVPLFTFAMEVATTALSNFVVFIFNDYLPFLPWPDNTFLWLLTLYMVALCCCYFGFFIVLFFVDLFAFQLTLRPWRMALLPAHVMYAIVMEDPKAWPLALIVLPFLLLFGMVYGVVVFVILVATITTNIATTMLPPIIGINITISLPVNFVVGTLIEMMEKQMRGLPGNIFEPLSDAKRVEMLEGVEPEDAIEYNVAMVRIRSIFWNIFPGGGLFAKLSQNMATSPLLTGCADQVVIYPGSVYGRLMVYIVALLKGYLQLQLVFTPSTTLLMYYVGVAVLHGLLPYICRVRKLT